LIAPLLRACSRRAAAGLRSRASFKSTPTELASGVLRRGAAHCLRMLIRAASRAMAWPFADHFPANRFLPPDSGRAILTKQLLATSLRQGDTDQSEKTQHFSPCADAVRQRGSLPWQIKQLLSRAAMRHQPTPIATRVAAR